MNGKQPKSLQWNNSTFTKRMRIRSLCLQGNCSTDPPPEFLDRISNQDGIPIRPRKVGMCMLLAPQDVLYHRSGNLWLSNLYIRVARNESSVDSALTLVSVSDPDFDSKLWLTDSILQGDGGLRVNSLTVSSKAYVGGAHSCLFWYCWFGCSPGLRLSARFECGACFGNGICEAHGLR
jgi:hypothetical protein